MEAIKEFLNISSGYGYGDGYGSGYGVKTFCGKNVYLIDGVPTIIESARGNIAKGHILQNDFSLTPCFVVKLIPAL